MPMEVGSLIARLTLETDQYDRDLGRARNSFRDLARTADQSTSGLGRGFQDSRRDVTQFSDTMGRAQTGIRQDLARTEQAGRQSAQGLNNAFRHAFDGADEGMRSAMDNVSAHASSAGGESGGGFMAAFGPKVAQLGSKAGPIGAALVGLGAVGFGAGMALADQIMAGFDLQQKRGEIQASFGLSNAQMETVGKAAGAAYANAWGDSVTDNMSAAGVAMQAGLLNASASADDIQPVIEQLQVVSKVMGTEIPETARAAGQMIKTGLVGSSTEAFDLLTAAQHKGLNLSDDLLEVINEYGTQWRKVGFSGADAMGLISQAVQGGARDSDIAADAIKEFSIRVVDGSTLTEGAFESLGLNVAETAEAFGKGGTEARNMADIVMDKLRAIQDPIERNQVGVALFGTQWEDLGGAINNMDLSNAADQLGQVGGATELAGQQMSGAAGSIEGAKHQIEMAADAMKIKLGEAFAPLAQDFGAWATRNQDAITGFFLSAADAGLAFGEGLLRVGEYGGEFVAGFMRYGANFLDYFTIPILNGVREVGAVMSHLPGSAGKMGDSIRDGADTARAALGETRDALRSGAEGVDALGEKFGQAADKIGPMRKSLQEQRDDAYRAQDAFNALSTAIDAVPGAKSVIVTDNSPQAIQGMKDLGLTVTTLPNGNVRVDADTAAAQTALNEITKPKSVQLTVDMIQANSQDPIDLAVMAAFRKAQKKADGGRVGGGGGPRADDQLIWASSPEWVIQSSAAEKYGPAAMNAVNNGTAHIMAFANGGQVGAGPAAYGLPPGATGGFPDWVNELGTQYGVKPSTYAGHQESNRTEAGYAPNPQGLNRGIDWGGSVAQMQAFAEAMYARAQSDSAIEQIIWQNPQTGQKIGWHGRSPDTDGSYFANDYAGHQNHVHLRVASQIGAVAAQGKAGQRTIPLVKNADGTWTSTDPSWAALIKRESGGKSDIVQQVQDANSGGNEASGLFQIAKGTWTSNGGAEFAPTAGEADAEKQAIVAARIFDASGGSPWGAGLAGREDEAGLRAGITTTATPTTDPLMAENSGVQNVFVTGGRLDGATTDTSTPTPSKPAKTSPAAPDATAGPLPLRAYADGGFGGQPDGATMLQSARAWVTLAGEAGRELYLPMDGSQRSRDMWMQAGSEMGLIQAFATGGFGGYSKDKTDAAKPRDAYDWLALGVGGAMTAASIAEPYIGMATSKQVTLGDLSPTIDTGANSIPGSSAVVQAIQAQTEALTRQTAELIKAANEGKNIHVSVNGQDPTHGLGLALGARGR